MMVAILKELFIYLPLYFFYSFFKKKKVLKDSAKSLKQTTKSLFIFFQGFGVSPGIFVRYAEVLGEKKIPFICPVRQYNFKSLHKVLKSIRLDFSLTNFENVFIVAHSYGGIIAKDFINTILKETNNIEKVIFIFTPHRGTRCVRFIPKIGGLKSISEEKDLEIKDHNIKIINIINKFDEFVFPAEMQEYIYVSVRKILPIYGHTSVLFNTYFFSHLIESLTEKRNEL